MESLQNDLNTLHRTWPREKPVGQVREQAGAARGPTKIIKPNHAHPGSKRRNKAQELIMASESPSGFEGKGL